MTNLKCCPYCGSRHIEETVRAFIEMGHYDSGAYALEGDAECYVCQETYCGRKFWANGPEDEMCYALVNTEKHDVLSKHIATKEGRETARTHLINEATCWCDKHNVPADVREKKLKFAEQFDEVHLDGIGTLEIRILCMED